MLKAYYEALAGSRRLAATCVVLLFVSGLAEALGIAALLPLLSSRLAPGAGGQSEWFGLTGDALILASIGALVVLGLLAAILRYLGDSKSYVLSFAVEYSMRSRIVTALMNMRWTAYQRMVVGEGIKSVLVEGEQVGLGTFALVQALGNAAVVAAFVAAAAVINPVMTAAVLVFGGLTALIYRRVGRKSQALSRELSGRGTVIGELTTDLLTNAKFYRSTGLGDRVRALVDIQFAAWAQQYGRVRRYIPATRLAADSAGLLFIGGALAGTLVVSGNSVASALVFVALFYRLAPRLQLAQQSVLQARTLVAWWYTWKEQYDTAAEAADESSGTRQFRKLPSIELDGVSLTYPGRVVPALTDVSCSIMAGECLAVVGESGSGKTTVLDLITGLLRPTAGAVRIGGAALEDVDLQEWRSHIGLVMQDNPAFQGTILENITWMDPEPDEDRARRVAAMAHLTEVIDGLPDGLETEIGQKGGHLSGGQRQRLALARALYREPWLLILDEATSALDSESEGLIQDALRTLRGSCSMLLVAHRLKTVQMADRILVLSHGQVVEEGSWDELSGRDGVFRRMLTAQLSGHPQAGLLETR
jgi:ABC-type multidrug transport system fused ATPase/permease subunit